MTKPNEVTEAKPVDNSPCVFVVDDDDAVRESIAFLLGSVSIRCETFASAESFLENYDATRRGCLVLDVRMPGMSGIQLHQRMREKRLTIPVIILTAHSDVPMAVETMKNGAFDLIEKPCNDQVLLERIQEAIKKDADLWLDERLLKQAEERLIRLSPREKEVMGYVVAGYLNKQIAEMMDVSIKTVEVHRSRVMQKMEAPSLADLVRMATLLGMD